MNSRLPAAASIFLAFSGFAQSTTTSFEMPDISQGTGIYYGDALVWYRNYQTGEILDGWTVIQGSADIVRHTTGTARDGSQSVDVNGYAAATLRRQFSTFAGRRYRLELDFSGNPIDGLVRTLEVRVNGTALAAWDWDPSARGNSFQFGMQWEKRQVEFVAAGETTAIELASLRPGSSGPQIDNIVFFEVPDASVTIENAILLTWPVPAGGPLGSILEGASQADGPWQVVKPSLLSLTPDGKVAVTIPATEAVKFYRLRPAAGG